MARGEARPRRERRQAEPGCPTPSLGLLRGVPATDAPAFVSVQAAMHLPCEHGCSSLLGLLDRTLRTPSRPLPMALPLWQPAMMAACHPCPDPTVFHGLVTGLPAAMCPHSCTLCHPGMPQASCQASCINHASIMLHDSCINRASSMHQSCIKHASNMHQACIKHASSIMSSIVSSLLQGLAEARRTCVEIEEKVSLRNPARRLMPVVRRYATPALRLPKPQHQATQNKASQNLEWPRFPGRRTPGLMISSEPEPPPARALTVFRGHPGGA